MSTDKAQIVDSTQVWLAISAALVMRMGGRVVFTTAELGRILTRTSKQPVTVVALNIPGGIEIKIVSKAEAELMERQGKILLTTGPESGKELH